MAHDGNLHTSSQVSAAVEGTKAFDPDSPLSAGTDGDGFGECVACDYHDRLTGGLCVDCARLASDDAEDTSVSAMRAAHGTWSV